MFVSRIVRSRIAGADGPLSRSGYDIRRGAGAPPDGRDLSAGGRDNPPVAGPERFDVVCIGHATRDAIAEVERWPRRDDRVIASDLVHAGGGPAATAAVTLARLGHRVALVASVGDDDTGRAIRDELAAEGVDVDGVRVIPGARSATSLILVDPAAGTRAIAAYLGTTGPIALDDRARRRVAGAEWVHVDHRGAALLRELQRAGSRRLSVDAGNPGWDLDLRGIALFAPTRRVLAARHPGRSLSAAVSEALAEGAATVVVTEGARGALAARGDERFRVAAVPVSVRSTLGAGDVFHGALLAGLLRGSDLRGAVTFATVAAALSCRALDGRSAIPTAVELERALADAA